MSEQRLTKIVYAYDIYDDNIAARHYYDNGKVEIIRHSHSDWRDLLYDIRKNQQSVIIMSTVEEYMQ